jgi:hypothetical protein
VDHVLDLDLDFFVWPISRNLTDDCRLPEKDFWYLSSDKEVCGFLEERCQLNATEPILGQQFIEHEDAFRVWRRWLNEGTLTAPFKVTHVDAHADLGAGWNTTCVCIEKILAMPLSQRANPPFSADGVTSANYLSFAMANRWVSSLNYVFPTEPQPSSRPRSRIEVLQEWLNDGSQHDDPPVRDLPPWCFQSEGEGWWRNPIQLGREEPEIPFKLVKSGDFLSERFTHMVVAQSPQYTPESADPLLSTVRRYFRAV